MRTALVGAACLVVGVEVGWRWGRRVSIHEAAVIMTRHHIRLLSDLGGLVTVPTQTWCEDCPGIGEHEHNCIHA